MTVPRSRKIPQFKVQLTFHGDLPFFLRSKKAKVERPLAEKTSVKDVIEACGVPHTEVDLIMIGGEAFGFERFLTQDAVVDVYGIDSHPTTFFPEKHLQVRNTTSFVADGHLGKLVRDLRLLGIDVSYDRNAGDRELVRIGVAESRALLTRDRRLLMHAVIKHGYYLRSQNPLEQTVEVLRRFELVPGVAPFSRCLRCNMPLEPVEKHSVMAELEPLTKIYYEDFRRCRGCSQVYWSGSHFDKLMKRIATIRSRMASATGV